MRYYLAHNEIDVFHYGKIDGNQEIETGLEFLEFYNTIEELNGRLIVFSLSFTNTENVDNLIIEDGNGLLPFFDGELNPLI
jgi:hypothetical protein